MSRNVTSKQLRAMGFAVAPDGTARAIVGKNAKRVARGMNAWEREYARQLDLRISLGDAVAWKFEAVKLRLADGAFYKPDFLVVLASGAIEFVEVKGHWREAAKVRFKIARELFAPIVFIAVTRDGDRWITLDV